jgi:hypothetical protein
MKKLKDEFTQALRLDPSVTSDQPDVEMGNQRVVLSKGDRKRRIKELRKQGINPFINNPLN